MPVSMLYGTIMGERNCAYLEMRLNVEEWKQTRTARAACNKATGKKQTSLRERLADVPALCTKSAATGLALLGKVVEAEDDVVKCGMC